MIQILELIKLLGLGIASLLICTITMAEIKNTKDFMKAIEEVRKEYPEESTFNPVAENIVIVDAINHALHEEMELNEKMVVYGQDIADPKGGVFTATKGLSDKFGNGRVFNSPLAESSIVGTAVGMAV